MTTDRSYETAILSNNQEASDFIAHTMNVSRTLYAGVVGTSLPSTSLRRGRPLQARLLLVFVFVAVISGYVQAQLEGVLEVGVETMIDTALEMDVEIMIDDSLLEVNVDNSFGVVTAVPTAATTTAATAAPTPGTIMATASPTTRIKTILATPTMGMMAEGCCTWTFNTCIDEGEPCAGFEDCKACNGFWLETRPTGSSCVGISSDCNGNLRDSCCRGLVCVTNPDTESSDCQLPPADIPSPMGSSPPLEKGCCTWTFNTCIDESESCAAFEVCETCGGVWLETRPTDSTRLGMDSDCDGILRKCCPGLVCVTDEDSVWSECQLSPADTPGPTGSSSTVATTSAFTASQIYRAPLSRSSEDILFAEIETILESVIGRGLLDLQVFSNSPRFSSSGLLQALRIMYEYGIGGNDDFDEYHFYLGNVPVMEESDKTMNGPTETTMSGGSEEPQQDDEATAFEYRYGLVNLAMFLSQLMAMDNFHAAHSCFVPGNRTSVPSDSLIVPTISPIAIAPIDPIFLSPASSPSIPINGAVNPTNDVVNTTNENVNPTNPPRSPTDAVPSNPTMVMTPTRPPFTSTKAPITPTVKPMRPTNIPINPTDLPVSPTTTSENPTDIPVTTPTDAPVDPADTPVSPTDSPVFPTEAPSARFGFAFNPIDAPVIPTDAPVNPTDAPVNPTDAPVNPTDAPINPIDAPVNPTEAPIDPSNEGINSVVFQIDPTIVAREPDATSENGTGDEMTMTFASATNTMGRSSPCGAIGTIPLCNASEGSSLCDAMDYPIAASNDVCSCVLGQLNRKLGISPVDVSLARNGVAYYDDDNVNFCNQTKSQDGLCTDYDIQYDEGTFLVPMASWILNIQRYSSATGWNYINELRKLVDNEMDDEQKRILMLRVSSIVMTGSHVISFDPTVRDPTEAHFDLIISFFRQVSPSVFVVPNENSAAALSFGFWSTGVFGGLLLSLSFLLVNTCLFGVS